MNEKYDDFFLVQVGQLSLAHFEMYYLKTRIHKMRMMIDFLIRDYLEPMHKRTCHPQIWHVGDKTTHIYEI